MLAMNYQKKHSNYLEYSIRLNKEWSIEDRLTEEIEEAGLDTANTEYWKIKKRP